MPLKMAGYFRIKLQDEYYFSQGLPNPKINKSDIQNNVVSLGHKENKQDDISLNKQKDNNVLNMKICQSLQFIFF